MYVRISCQQYCT